MGTMSPALGVIAGIVFYGLILAAIAIPAYKAYHSSGTSKPAAKYVCTSCHSRVTPRRWIRGSSLMEIILWLFFLLPGFIYSLWRRMGPIHVCPICSAANPVPIATPAGQQIISQG